MKAPRKWQFSVSRNGHRQFRRSVATRWRRACILCFANGIGTCARGGIDFCRAHGGGKRCQHPEGCDKSAEGATDFCISHGGGKRCKHPEGCDKSARAATDFCKAHGGGKRCKHPEGCDKSAQGATDFCKAHGGGKRCKHPEGCDKSAEGATDFCKAHGGGKRCKHNRIICTEGACGLIPSAAKCVCCCSKQVKRKKGDPLSHLCAECRSSETGQKMQRIKSWELEVADWLNDEGLVWSYSNKKLPCAPTTRYPDYLFIAKDHVVLLEVDEHQHSDRDPACELARLSELMDSIGTMNMHVIRYNPHTGDDNRRSALISAIRSAIDYNQGARSDSGMHVQYLGYSASRIQLLELTAHQMQLNALNY